MSYEYKEEILLDIGPEPNCNYESESNRYYDKVDELDRVYAQAAKAAEYEAKAKAFDEIIHAINISSQPRQSGRRYIDKFEFTKKAENIIEKYERGESND